MMVTAMCMTSMAVVMSFELVAHVLLTIMATASLDNNPFNMPNGPFLC